ncbi:hypothetical protein LJC72_09760, partial [Bacteroides sp. OttesenSCG-928-D19]|nr:hypothetical protein [Bacteroides sp. OttesenSCG-928-D19]
MIVCRTSGTPFVDIFVTWGSASLHPWLKYTSFQDWGFQPPKLSAYELPDSPVAPPQPHQPPTHTLH